MYEFLKSLIRRPSRQTASRRRRSNPSRIENLEDRCLLAAAVWDGGGATSNWSDAANWDNDVVPATGDDVTIDLTGSPYTVNLDVNIALGQTTEHLSSFTLNSANATLSATGRTLTVNGGSNVTAGAVTWDNSVWAGTGTLTVGAIASVDMRDTTGDVNPSEISASLINNGSMLVRGFDNAFSGSVVNETTGSITIQTENVYGEGSQLTLANGMTNRGTVTLHSQKTTTAGLEWNLLTSTAGTIVNEVGALIRTTNTGIANGLPTIPHYINAVLDNRGTVSFTSGKADQRINKSGADHFNSGLIEVTGSSSLYIHLFNSFDNSGLVDTGIHPAFFSSGGRYTNRVSGDIQSDVHARFNTVTSVLGVGTINTDVDVINSNFDPGLSPGILNISGNYLQNSNSSLTIEIGGTLAGNGAGFHDQVNVNGSVTIGSNVALNTASFGGHVPAGGDSYVIINNDGTDTVSGTFAGLAEGAVISTDFLGSGETATITYAGGTDNNDVVIKIVDITPPNPPSTPDLDPVSDSGLSNTDDLTNVTTPTFSGTAEPDSTVELFSDVTGSLGTVAANATTGTWSITSGVALADGTHHITAIATNTALNVSAASGVLTVTIDTAAPATPGIPDLDASSDTGSSNTDDITADTTPTISGTAEPNGIVEIFDGGTSLGTTTANGTGDWTFTASTLADGLHNLTAAATDAAGNVSAASGVLTVTIDTAAPATPATPDLDAGSDTGSSNTDDITADETPTISGTAEANATVEMFGGTTAPGTTTVNTLGSGPFTAPNMA
ncbi:MAG: hypothetical protein GY903_16450, partial [Fuerstiella sp.]|nr:hypothetical protein [Fuerstiella sp.]